MYAAGDLKGLPQQYWLTNPMHAKAVTLLKHDWNNFVQWCELQSQYRVKVACASLRSLKQTFCG